MKSGKQRRAEIKAGRLQRAEKHMHKLLKEARPWSLQPKSTAPVDMNAFIERMPICAPNFMFRGYYIDKNFVCKDCGAACVWKAEKQKLWYEDAQGDLCAIAVRCAPCRAKERVRVAQARETSAAGLARKVIRKAMCLSH